MTADASGQKWVVKNYSGNAAARKDAATAREIPWEPGLEWQRERPKCTA
jgi:hypothetical protein